MYYRIILFLAVFTAITAFIYAAFPRKKRRLVLLASSLIFYSIFSGFAAVFLLATILTTYIAAIIIDKVPEKFSTEGLSRDERKAVRAKIKSKKRIILIIYLIINIGFLAVLKYYNFFSSTVCSALGYFGVTASVSVINLIMPLGISYYTLQATSYVIDVLRGKYPADKSLINIALFIGYFPQLNEGPFGRYDLLMHQMTSGDDIKKDNIFAGIAQILCGAFKIFIISNRAAIISTNVFSNYSDFSGFSIVLGILAFTLQLYADFSGYIDIATGISKIFGIELAKNFDMPFLAENVSDFWRRWHISLGAWFRDYIFYPLSTSKFLSKAVKKLKPATADFVTITVSLFAVWFLTGLWHGASSKYIAYGLYYFVLMIAFNLLSPLSEKLIVKLKTNSDNKIIKTIRIIKTFILVQIGMLIFRADDLTVCMKMFRSIFISNEAAVSQIIAIDSPDLIVLLISILILVLSAVLKFNGIEIKERFNKLSSFKKYWICFSIACVTIIFGAYGLG
ncbi:MAG: MBOAT family O-acyltransferase, partial [Oscillospiraceae bacterium]